MNKDLSLLGLAKKAGRLAVGNDAVLEALHTNRARVVLFAEDAGENTVRRFQNKCGDVPITMLSYSKETLGAAVGFKSCAVAAIGEEGFAAAFWKASSPLPGNVPGGGLHNKPKETNI